MGTVTARVVDSGGHSAQASVPYAVSTLGRHVGADCPVGDLSETYGLYGPIRYMRDFGSGSGNATLLSLPGATRPVRCRNEGTLVHYSMKSYQPSNVASWLAGADLRWWSYWHEMDNDDPITPAQYKATYAQAWSQIQAHPNGHLVTRNGPIFVGYRVLQGTTDPDDWMPPAADSIWFDRYGGPWIDNNPGYPTPQWTFGGLAAVARGYGLPWGIPEWGCERRPDDPTGQGRAAYIRACGTWLAAQPDFLGAGWWQRGGCRIEQGTPEQTALAEVLALLA